MIRRLCALKTLIIFKLKRRKWISYLCFIFFVAFFYRLSFGLPENPKRTRVILHKLDASPPSRAVVMLCKLINLDVQMIDIMQQDPSPTGPAFLKLSTLRTVPVLVDNNLIIEDSNAILQYLADVYGNIDSLYPKDAKKRALVNQKLFFDAGILYPRIEDSVFPAVLEGVIRIPQKRMKDIEEAYGYLEDFLDKNKFLAGEVMTIADIAAIASVTSLVYILPIDPDKFPRISAWMDIMKKEKFCIEHNERGADLFGHMIMFDHKYNDDKSRLYTLLDLIYKNQTKKSIH